MPQIIRGEGGNMIMTTDLFNPVLYAQKKNELQGNLDKLRKNVEGVGSYELLKQKYPTPYKKLLKEINEGFSFLIQESETRIYAPCESTKHEIANVWLKDYREEARKALYKDYNVATALSVIEQYKIDMVMNYNCSFQCRRTTED